MKKFKTVANETVFRYPTPSYFHLFLSFFFTGPLLEPKLGRFWINWIESGKDEDGIPSITVSQNTLNQSIMHELTFTNSSSMRQFAPSSLLEPSRNCQNECGCSRPNPHLPTFLYSFLQFDHPQPFLLYVFLLQKMSLIWVNILTSPRPFSLIYQP